MSIDKALSGVMSGSGKWISYLDSSLSNLARSLPCVWRFVLGRLHIEMYNNCLSLHLDADFIDTLDMIFATFVHLIFIKLHAFGRKKLGACFLGNACRAYEVVWLACKVSCNTSSKLRSSQRIKAFA